MIKIADIVQEIIENSEVAQEGLTQGILNFRAYAKKIQPLVEEKLEEKTGVKKTAKLGTLVVSLSRIAKSIEKKVLLKPPIKFDDVNIKTHLCDVTYEKTRTNLRSAHKFLGILERDEKHFFTVTEGTNEITFIISEALFPELKKYFETEPKAVLKNLTGITMQFSKEYLGEPNVIYSILSNLAIKRINIIEVVSTYTTLTIIVEQKERMIAEKQLD